MKKLLFVTTRLFWPTDSGRKVSLYYYCKGLHEKYGYDIYLYSFLEPGQSEETMEKKPDFIKEIRLAAPLGKLKKLTSLFSHSLFCGWPFQNSIYYSSKNKKNIQEYCKEIQPDVVFVDMIRLAPYYSTFKDLVCQKVLDLDDLLSQRYERQLNNKNDKGSLFGAFSTKDQNIKNSKLKRMVLKMESKRVRKAEIKYAKQYDKVVFVSDIDTEHMNSILPNKAVTVRLGVDYKFLSDVKETVLEKNTITFLGNLKYSPNVASLDVLVNEILPQLDFDYTLKIIGSCPEEIKEKYQNDKIIFLGRVEDQRPIIQSSLCFAGYISYGSGVKTKILESLAIGGTVVTNSLGIEGIDFKDTNDYCYVTDDLKEYANIINEIHKDNSIAIQKAKKAQEFIKEKYDWETIYSSFEFLEEKEHD